ncbi:Teichoic acid translocation permease protein TagG [Anaerolineales bacterium]|nr:Teichoic acid translocation permease protein TagG [Anaerolineales bacterium]
MANTTLSPYRRIQKPLVTIEPQRGWVSLELAELWRYRELLFLLTWRDIKVRYKQTVLGATWAIIQPLLTMLIFSLIFGQLAKLPSDGIPYPIFTFTALLPWQLFAFSLVNSSQSLVGNQNLVSKVYFPRLVMPIASVFPGLADFSISLFVLIGMMIYYQIPLTARILTLPFFLLLALASALAVGLWLSALNVEYRDIRYVVPFLTLFWQYATPVAYSASLIPEKWRLLYGLNPMTGVVEGFRWALLGSGNIDRMVWVSTAIIILILISGLAYFRRMEATFADVI